MAREWIAVALGGMLGAVSRHALSWIFSLIGPSWLPIATLAANVGGCFLIGLLSHWAFHRQLSAEWWVIGIRVGLLGGLTTFSSFGLDLVRLWTEDRSWYAINLGLAHIVLGLLAVVAGLNCTGLTARD